MYDHVILVGSYARGTANDDSDVDVLRIGNTSTPCLKNICTNETYISYIDFNKDEFSNLYKKGSLFLLHAFEEGEVLSGDKEIWWRQRQSFRPSLELSPVIRQYIALACAINRNESHVTSFVSYLSNMYKVFKNIGICKLAMNNQVSFDKKTALEKGSDIRSTESATLILSNNCYERNVAVSDEELEAMRVTAKLIHSNWRVKVRRALQ